MTEREMTQASEDTCYQANEIQTDDPTPPVKPENSEELIKYKEDLEGYSSMMFKLYNEAPFIKGGLLWNDFTTMFRPEGIRNLSIASVTRWRNLLLERGVFVHTGRGVLKRRALLNCLMQSCFRPLEGTVLATRSDDAAAGSNIRIPDYVVRRPNRPITNGELQIRRRRYSPTHF